LELIRITFQSQRCNVDAFRALEGPQDHTIVTPERLLALGILVCGLGAITLLNTQWLARKGGNKSGSRFSTAA
jgi:hypothetical protein